MYDGAVRAAADIAPDRDRRHAAGIAFIERGAGEPLVLVHGVGLNAEAWTPQIEHFSRTHRVIAVDMLGHGESRAAPRNADIHAYSRQIAELLDSLGIQGANVAGHSMGALASIGFALAFPDRCLRLAALNAVYCREAATRAAVEARAAELAEARGAGDIEAPLRRWFGDKPRNAERAAADLVRRWLGEAQPDGYAQAYRIFSVSDRLFEGRLKHLSMPALFMTGSLDPNSTPAMSRAMAACAPKGYAVVIEGRRHVMSLTDPETTNAELQRWLAKT